jgi:hypothetical protein
LTWIIGRDKWGVTGLFVSLGSENITCNNARGGHFFRILFLVREKRKRAEGWVEMVEKCNDRNDEIRPSKRPILCLQTFRI